MAYQLLAIVDRSSQSSFSSNMQNMPITEIKGDQHVAIWLAQAEKKSFESAKKHKIRALVAFQKALEIYQACGPMLPGLFGTTTDTPADIKATLNAFSTEISTKLKRYGTKRQFQLELNWPTQEALAVAKKASADLSAPKDKSAIAEQIGVLLDRARRAAFDQYQHVLTSLEHETLNMPSEDPSVGMNVMTLIAGDQEAAYDKAVAAFDESLPYDPRITLKGPLPACSFASVRLDPITALNWENSCARLGLSGHPTDDEVRAGFAKTAYKSHPDQNGTEGDRADLSALKADRDFLLASLKAKEEGATQLLTFISDRDFVA